MKQKWYGICVTCPKCGTSATLQIAAYSSDGELQFTCYCPDCKELLHWRVFASALAHMALRHDLEDVEKPKETRQRIGKAIRPPLALNAPPAHLTVNDTKWLKEMSIDPEEGTLQ